MQPSENRAGGDGRKSDRSTPILIALIGALATVLVGYWQFGRPPQAPAPAPAPQPIQVVPPAQDTDDAEVSRDFIIGRWQVEQAAGQLSGGTLIDYQEDGTFSGWITQFVNGMGQKQPVEGRWDYQRLAKDRFRLYLQYPTGETWQGTFKIRDRNHILNIDQNYEAVRLE